MPTMPTGAQQGVYRAAPIPKAAPKTYKNSRKQNWLNRLEYRAPRPFAFLLRHRAGVVVNVLFSVLVPLVTIITLEWIARGTLGPNEQGSGFFQTLIPKFPSFLIAYLLLMALYVFISQLSGSHLTATLLVGATGVIPAIVTYYKLTLRGEPFLPWDLIQIDDLMGVKSNLEFEIPSNVYITIGIFFVLSVLAFFAGTPRTRGGRPRFLQRFVAAATALVCLFVLLFGIFLSPAGTAAIGIQQDMWMQDRYYRRNGVITGFLTNLQMLNITEPQGYSANAVQAILQQMQDGTDEPLFENSFAAGGGTVEQPDIIFLMAESFWDVTALDGIEYDQPLLSNLQQLSAEGASGTAYTPSFGGGTCDVEFEALTGFSMEHLPSGSKPFQQYVTDDMFSLPQVLKSEGYQTLAIHGYGRRFWNRDTAYPRLGIDDFIASEDFVYPVYRRGFISDIAMVGRIVEELEAREADGPVFIHAVTMQNHTTYSRSRYPVGELVKVTESPAALPDATIGQLEDCATGIREMDAALGKLAEYLRTRERPTILVFWGDHMNPMSDGYALFEETGYIAMGDTAAPQLRETPLLYWSNFDTSQVDIGTIATYNITSVLMELYGLEQPEMFAYLTSQLSVMRGRTRGVTIRPDGSYSLEMTERQQETFNSHAILQYDYMFGEQTLNNYVSKEEEAVSASG